MDREIKATINEKLHKALRIRAAELDIPLKELIAAILEEALNERDH